MTTTKKFPVSISFSSFKATTDEFVVPAIPSIDSNDFIGIRSGKRFPYGAVSYIGKAISAGDVLEKMESAGMNVGDKTVAIDTLERFLVQLQDFKVGNILTIQYSGEGDFTLVKVAERPGRNA